MRGTQVPKQNHQAQTRCLSSVWNMDERGRERAEDEAKMEIKDSESERKRRLEAKQLGRSGDAEAP
ncbi:uncharacterized protein TrAtP1_005727 [Trichoderma atroviride]|uniref:uncharacterized protein n=1 Tax=Hypocrea atroviridis TaxID=63577 RepID=UPI0033255069|nr:hypothetical protein TrAtP1_005727 [Trichoderma atroviride]